MEDKNTLILFFSFQDLTSKIRDAEKFYQYLKYFIPETEKAA